MSNPISTDAGTFTRSRNAGTAICSDCGARRQKANIDISTGLCPICYTQAGLENEHQDGGHGETPDAICRMCIADLTAVTARMAAANSEAIDMTPEQIAETAPIKRCECGCGAATSSSKRRFRQGHDMKLKSAQLKAARDAAAPLDANIEA